MGRVDPCNDMTQLAQTILIRIRRNRHQTVAGSYLLGDADGNVYVLAEGAGTTEALVAEHEAWLVGRYAAGSAVVFPLAVDLVDDLRDHYANLVPAMVYEAIRSEEG